MDQKLLEDLKDSLIKIKDVRGKIGEKRFRDLLEFLNADLDLIKNVSEIVRSFDENSKTFRNPYQRMMEIIGDDHKRREMFLKAVHDFDPGRRGIGRGLNEFAQEFRQERNEIGAILKKYFKLYAKRPNLSETESKDYREIGFSMPSSIKSELINTRSSLEGILRPQYKEIAAKWMIQYYPCTKKTLIQITRQASEKQPSENSIK